jgi:CRP/FNR family cyclic AMP-dependent transcriptional regulator
MSEPDPGATELHLQGKSTIEILAQIDLFNSVPQAHLRRVVDIGLEEQYRSGAGAYFGEMSLIDDATRSATAVCHERCRLFVVNRKDLEDLLFVDRDLAYELLWNWVRTLSRRLRATNDKMTFLATTSKF